MSLALQTLIYEWPRYLAAVTALALSGLMVLFEVGVFAGIIHSDFAVTERARADLIIMPPKMTSMVNGNPSLPGRVKPLIFLNPHVIEVASLEGDGDRWVNIPKPGEKKVQTFAQIWGVDTTPGSGTLPRDFTDDMRRALEEPGAIAVDEGDLAKLGVKLGDSAVFNGHEVHVRTLLHGYQSADNTVIVGSRDTLDLVQALGPPDTTGPLMVRVQNPAQAEIVRDQLNASSHGAYRAFTSTEFSQNNEKALMGQQIIGILLTFSVFVATLIGIGITSQTLRGAIASNIKEFASLRALGISMGSLRLIVMELSFWVGVVGLLAAGGMAYGASILSAKVGLPLSLNPASVIWVCVMLMVIAVLSGAMAMGILKKSDPADLLR